MLLTLVACAEHKPTVGIDNVLIDFAARNRKATASLFAPSVPTRPYIINRPLDKVSSWPQWSGTNEFWPS